MFHSTAGSSALHLLSPLALAASGISCLGLKLLHGLLCLCCCFDRIPRLKALDPAPAIEPELNTPDTIRSLLRRLLRSAMGLVLRVLLRRRGENPVKACGRPEALSSQP